MGIDMDIDMDIGRLSKIEGKEAERGDLEGRPVGSFVGGVVASSVGFGDGGSVVP